MHGRVLVGADGVNGRIARDAGLGGGILYGIALRLAAAAGTPAAPPSSSASSPAATAGVFPKLGHASDGVGGWAAEGPQACAHLRRLCAEHGVDDAELDDLHGLAAADPKDGERRPGPDLLVGDAAGLCADVALGDGIMRRSCRARLAAEAIAAGQPERDQNEPHAALGRFAETSWKAKLVLDRDPGGVRDWRRGSRRCGASSPGC